MCAGYQRAATGWVFEVARFSTFGRIGDGDIEKVPRRVIGFLHSGREEDEFGASESPLEQMPAVSLETSQR